MNEISNFYSSECSSSSSDNTTVMKKASNLKFDPNNPPYNINNQNSNAPLNTKTTSMDATHYGMNGLCDTGLCCV